MITACIQTINTDSVDGWFGHCQNHDAVRLMSGERKRNVDHIAAGVSTAQCDTRMHPVSQKLTNETNNGSKLARS